MERIIVECIPDKTLVRKLGFSKKEIMEAADKSRVYKHLMSGSNLVGLVDQDPSPDPNRVKYPYEGSLIPIKSENGLILLHDKQRDNNVVVFTGRLEDWLIDVCRRSKIDVKKEGLPDNGNQLHKIINVRLAAYEKLLERMLSEENNALQTLKLWLSK